MAESRLSLTFRDFDGEASSVVVRGADATADYGSALTLMDAVKAAIQGVSIGKLVNEVYVGSAEQVNTGNASQKVAQREQKWLVTGYDSVNYKAVSIEIPCADLSLLSDASDDPATRKSLGLTTGVGLALKDALEAYWRSPYGNSVVIQSVVHAGRNL